MKNTSRTHPELIEEIYFLKQRIKELEHAESDRLSAKQAGKRAEEQLRESEERFRLAINATEDGLWEWDIQTNKEFFSPRWCEIIGYSFDDPELPHTYSSWASRIHPDDHDRVISALNNHLENGTKYNVDYRHRHKSGEYRWQNSKGQAVFDESGKPTKMVGCIADITERKQLEEVFNESHKCLTNILDSLDSLIYVADFSSYEILFINRYGRNVWGDIQGQKCWQAIQNNQKGPCSFCTNDRLVSDTGIPTGVYQWEFQNTVNGRWYECRDQAITWIGKGLVRMEIATDITEHKLAEKALNDIQEQLFQTNRMASLGQLSAGAAHEINNPLAGIIGFTEATLSDLKNQKIAPDKIARSLGIVLKNAERCRIIMRNLLNFARVKELSKQESDINILIDDALALVEHKTTAQNIRVVKTYDKNPCKVNIDRDMMTQVFINVISNAQNAMPDGGELFVSTWSENNFALIEFKDTGTGIEKEGLLKVFDPFFTTRQPGQGVGLGLSISYSIIKRHDGSIEAKSDGKDKGTSFIIKIPAKGEINGHE